MVYRNRALCSNREQPTCLFVCMYDDKMRLVWLVLLCAQTAAAPGSSSTRPARGSGSTELPNSAGLTLLTQAVNATGARCLDGSPAAYYYRPFRAAENATKWIIFIKGGGWCTSIADCYERSLTTLGSSRSYAPTLDLTKEGGLISDDPSVNPMAADWNHVYLPYCDGASFTGSNQTTETYNNAELYFRGFRNLEAILADLVARRALKNATDLVLTGCSAGGLAAYLHADYIAALVPNATVIAAPDSGFFLDRDFPEHGVHYHTDLVWVFKQQNSTSGTDRDCIAARAHSDSAWKCMFAEHVAPFVSTPLFPFQSQYDLWQVRHILGNTSEPLVNAYGRDFSTTFIRALGLDDTQGSRSRAAEGAAAPFNGAFLDSCLHHCKEWNQISIRNHVTSSQALMAFYSAPKLSRSAQFLYYQNEPYECNDCCSSARAVRQAAHGSRLVPNG